jgi:hypothetical protein
VVRNTRSPPSGLCPQSQVSDPVSSLVLKYLDHGLIMSVPAHVKRAQRFQLARLIEESVDSMEITPRCGCCERDNLRCIVALDKATSKRCSECVRKKNVCDAMADPWKRNVPSREDFAALTRQERSYEEQEEEAMAKILRLRKQKRLLQKRRVEMSRRGLQFLDELDAAEQKEKDAAEQKEKEVSEKAITPSSPSFDLLLPTQPDWLSEFLSSSGDMPPAVPHT